jgi:hypothetical protein
VPAPQPESRIARAEPAPAPQVTRTAPAPQRTEPLPQTASPLALSTLIGLLSLAGAAGTRFLR